MKRSFGKLLPASLAALVLASFAMASYADAAAARGGGGGGGGARAAGGGGGGARAAGASGGGARATGAGGGGTRQSAQVNNSQADARTNNVRSTSVNNVNVDRDVNVNVEGHGGCCGGWDNDYHPVAAAAAVGTAVAVTSAVVGSMVRSVPPSCVPVNYGGMVYQQCGSTWYQPQGSQYVVVNPPY
jgi:hypothetical protein